jgi:TetR/AcrR family transcriptional repressor of nem operon
MDLAEERMRGAGYHGFSFRDIASKAGISSASVHHHFPTKAEMVLAIMRRYQGRFAELVASQPGETGDGAVTAYRTAFRNSLRIDGGMCLSGMLGAESGGLPTELHGEVETFFREAVDNLAGRIGGEDAEERALGVLATLEGGLILARAYGDVDAFDRATASLVATPPSASASRDLTAVRA